MKDDITLLTKQELIVCVKMLKQQIFILRAIARAKEEKYKKQMEVSKNEPKR